MIKVTLLGDSIRMIGYGLEVPALLGEILKFSSRTITAGLQNIR